jgi:hypothetical protein
MYENIIKLFIPKIDKRVETIIQLAGIKTMEVKDKN